MRIPMIGAMVFCFALACSIAAQPQEASAGPVWRVATWPVRAFVRGRCHGTERKAKTKCHGVSKAEKPKCGG